MSRLVIFNLMSKGQRSRSESSNVLDGDVYINYFFVDVDCGDQVLHEASAAHPRSDEGDTADTRWTGRMLAGESLLC